MTLGTPRNPLTVQNQTDTVTINGRTTTTTYIGPPRILNTTNPAGELTSATLDALGRPVRVYRSGFALVVYVYDSRGRLERVTEGEGAAARATVMTYDSLGYLDTVTDALLGVTQYNFDDAGRLYQQQLPSQQWLTFDYDDAGNLISQINAQGTTTTYEYDAYNRLFAQVVDPAGRAVRSEYFYDLADNLTRAIADVGTGRLNLTSHYTYTPFSPSGDYLLQQVIDPEGHATNFTYTPAGDLRTATDALGQTTTYTYTTQGWLHQMRTPQGRVATTLYTNDGQPYLVTDPRGSITDYVYDPQGRLKNVIAGTVAIGTAPALNQTITYDYDVNGRVRVVTDGRNQAHILSYDPFGRLDWERDPLGNLITYSYDKLDRLEEQIIGANNPAQAVTTRYSYDAAGRRTTMRLDPNGLNLTTVYSYTQPGSSDTWNLQQVRDPKGNVTKYSYNSLGLRANTTDALNHTWVFDYDNLGRLTRQTDPLGHFVEYVVDGLGRTAELRQDGRVESWAFRPDGALHTYTDFAGRVTTFAYDNDQLLTAIDYPAGMADVGYGYDAAGNVTTMNDGLGGASYSYDVLNRLDTRTRGSRVVDYGYSLTNQVTSIDYWGRGSVGYGYDNAGRLETLTPWGGAATSYSYRSSGQLAGITRPNTVATTYSYDTAGRLTGLHHVQGGATTLNNIVYGLDNNGNRDWMTDNDGLTDYVYDALNRLDAVTYPAIPGGPPAATIDYSMDEVGNRTGDGTTTYGHDASDRITNAGFVYDNNGNLLNDGVKSYEYDAANRLTKVISGSVTIDYAYDGWGNLILESSNGITTEFVLDERGALPTILGEVRSDGTERLYAYGPEGFAAQMTVGGAIEYPLVDGLGSVRHLTDGAGNVMLSRSYDAFGNLRHSTGTGVTRLGFTGELQDQMTGLVYLRARHYHPVLGRFLQRDSFAGFQQRPQSLNRYAYTENNPVNHRDPSGHYIDTLLDIGFIVYDIHRIIQDNILRDCDNLGENLLALVLDVGGALLPFATGLGQAGRAASHADDLYDLVRYADEVPGLSRFADDAVRHVDDVADSTRYSDDVAKNLDCLVNSFSADTPVMTD